MIQNASLLCWFPLSFNNKKYKNIADLKKKKENDRN